MTIISAPTANASRGSASPTSDGDPILDAAAIVAAAIAAGDATRVVAALDALDAAVLSVADTCGVEPVDVRSPHTDLAPELAAYIGAVARGDRGELAVVLGRLRDAIAVGVAVWSVADGV